jgi:hypothetical protein
LGRDERGTDPLEPLLIQSDERGFFIFRRRRETEMMAMRRRHTMAPFRMAGMDAPTRTMHRI